MISPDLVPGVVGFVYVPDIVAVRGGERRGSLRYVFVSPVGVGGVRGSVGEIRWVDGGGNRWGGISSCVLSVVCSHGS